MSLLHHPILVSVFMLSAVLALPNGSPVCGINEAQIAASEMRKSDSSLGYALKISFAGSNSWDITITNSAGRKDYSGILLYVHQVNQPQKHLGSFSFQDQTKWKYMAPQTCSSQNIVSSTPKATVTQAKEQAVSIAQNVVFRWTASPQELALSGLVAHAAIATNDAGKPKWQHLNFYGMAPIPLNASSAAAASSSSLNSTTPLSATNATSAANSTTSPTSTTIPVDSSATTNATSAAASSTSTHASAAGHHDRHHSAFSFILLLATLVFF